MSSLESFGHHNSSERPSTFPISDNLVQRELMRLVMDPAAPEPLAAWFSEEQGPSLAERFRTYVEDGEHANETIDIKDTASLKHLLDEVRNQLPTTLH